MGFAMNLDLDANLNLNLHSTRPFWLLACLQIVNVHSNLNGFRSSMEDHRMSLQVFIGGLLCIGLCPIANGASCMRIRYATRFAIQ